MKCAIIHLLCIRKHQVFNYFYLSEQSCFVNKSTALYFWQNYRFYRVFYLPHFSFFNTVRHIVCIQLSLPDSGLMLPRMVYFG